jgi:hypothetical protein
VPAVLYGAVTPLGVVFDLVIGNVLTPAIWVVVASFIDLVLLLNVIPTLPFDIHSITGIVLSQPLRSLPNGLDAVSLVFGLNW